MYLTIFPAAIEIKKRSVESVARPRYIPPPPPPSPSSSSWEEGSTTVDNSPKSWDAPVDGLLTYVLTGTSIAPIHFAEPGAKKLKDKTSETKVSFINFRHIAQSAQSCLGRWKPGRLGIAAWQQ